MPYCLGWVLFSTRTTVAHSALFIRLLCHQRESADEHVCMWSLVSLFYDRFWWGFHWNFWINISSRPGQAIAHLGSPGTKTPPAPRNWISPRCVAYSPGRTAFRQVQHDWAVRWKDAKGGSLINRQGALSCQWWNISFITLQEEAVCAYLRSLHISTEAAADTGVHGVSWYRIM